MSELLNPTDFGLPNLRLKPLKYNFKCSVCDDEVTSERWSFYFCPDCDIKRMVRINKSMDKLKDQTND